ncbi:murein biosynthesis integral membrane protein MurJ [Bifidobacterium polysaccharolyticum]|uniref:murein biosynthesis integral membrane protein MurJ n=1 Tax=Bifidobacterium polysaccharolyticum TaxID=2750967 RepID=UPI0021BB71F5|nr:murein biosynthesis integral membrane protein MurJ [Bifidobacterium polysaccharolyticum]MCT8157330.1 murein biosynthesis integral membrane protein MurJ [Bifidobacterium polysaccharolyticum]
MSSVGRNSAIMATGTAASRVTGQIRTILLAAAIGTTGIAADAYQTGAMIPQVMFTLISGGIFNAVLVPQIVRTLKERDAADRLNKLITVAMVLLALLTLLLMLGTPVLTTIYLNSKWNPAQRALANSFTLWCMPQVFFYGLYTVLGQILAAKGRFTAYAWSSVGANVISCLGFLIFIFLFGNARNQPVGFWDDGKVALTAGAWTLGVAFQALVLFIPLIMSGFRYRPRWGLRGIGLRSMGSVAAWSMCVVIVDQLANVVNARINNGAPLEGNPFDIAGNGSYQNAYTIFILPYSLVAVSVSTALFPKLSKAVSDGRIGDARNDLSQALRNVGLVMFFFAAVLLAIPVPITRALLPSVSVHESVLISGPLITLSLGLVPSSAFLLIQRTFYAFEDGRHPFIFAAVSNSIQVALVLVSIRLFPPRYWAALVGLSLSLSSILSFPALTHMLRSPFQGNLDERRILTTYAKAFLAAGLALAAALTVKTPVTHLVGAWIQGRQGHMSWVQALFICVVITLLTAVIYVVTLVALRTEEFTQLLIDLARRLGRATRHPVRSMDALQGRPSRLADRSVRVVHSSSPDSALPGMDAALENFEEAHESDADGESAIAGPPPAPPTQQPVRIVPRNSKVHHGVADYRRRPTSDESSATMNAHIGDTILGRYTLVTLLRRANGLSAWRAKDKVLERDCQLFIAGDSTCMDRINVNASSLALSKDRRFTPVYQLHTRDKVSLIVTAPDAGMSLRDYMHGPAGGTLSDRAIGTIMGEVTEAMRTLHAAGMVDYAVSTSTIRLAPASITLADAPISPMLEHPSVSTEMGLTDEEYAIHELAGVLYAMLTRRANQDGRQPSLQELPKQTPEEFKIICMRGLGLANEQGAVPVPLVTLAELSALLSPWVPPEELTDSDLIWPEMDGRASIEAVALRPVDPKNVLPLPAGLTSSALPAAQTVSHHEPHWKTNQLLFPGRSEIEMLNPEDTDTDLFSLFDERQRLRSLNSSSRKTAAMNEEESKAVTGRVPTVKSDQRKPSEALSGNGVTADNPVERGFSQWDFHKSGNSQAKATSNLSAPQGNVDSRARQAGAAAAEPIVAGESAARNAHSPSAAASDKSKAPSQAPSQANRSFKNHDFDEEEQETTVMEPLPPSFTPEIHSMPAPVTYSVLPDDEQDNDLDDEADMANTRLFGRFTTRSVVIAIAAVIVVVALVWALSTITGSRSKVGKSEGGWPVMSNVPFPGKTNDNGDDQAQADAGADKVSHADKKAGKVPDPPKPKNTTAYPISRQLFLNKPAGLQGYGWYMHLTQPEEVSRLTIVAPQSGGHAQIYANSTAAQPNQGQPLADFSFDASGTTQVTLREPVTTQDLVVWVPMDGMPGNTLRFTSVQAF